jgi:Metallo-beta-lactamase superfamily
MIFSLDVRRARKGDCLLLHFGTKEAPRLALIDAGPKGVYGPQLKPRLEQIRKARKLDDSKPLPIDLLMVSHVDDDHIKGILDLTAELIAAAGVPRVAVRKFWHNSYADLVGKEAEKLTANVTAQFGAASVGGELPDGATLDSDEDAEVVSDTLKVLANIPQGVRLAGDAKKLDWDLNPEYDGKVVVAAKGRQQVAKGLEFVVAGPLDPELKRLRQAHLSWLAKLKKDKLPAAKALAAYIDDSIPNLSSIVVLASVGPRRMLLTGDARGDKILAGLESVGVMKKNGSLHVDLLKVPHHGSSNNVEPAFFERITADHYVFSGNGEHGNPERETIEMLLAARKKAPLTIHITYPIDEIDAARKVEWEHKQADEKKRKAEGKDVTPRPNWSPAKNAIAKLLPSKLAPKQHLLVVDSKKAHVIDLLDPLGF